MFPLNVDLEGCGAHEQSFLRCPKRVIRGQGGYRKDCFGRITEGSVIKVIAAVTTRHRIDDLSVAIHETRDSGPIWQVCRLSRQGQIGVILRGVHRWGASEERSEGLGV